MRIDQIDLVRFGHFKQRDIQFPQRQPDYYVIYGDNEAGKSTLLRSISSLLFGVPPRTPDVHSCKPSELRVGATISEGRTKLSFRRRKGTTGTLLGLDDAQIQEDALTPFLRELDRERFEQFFGLNHERLRQGGEELLRGKGEIGSVLFQAAGFLELRSLLQSLDKEARELFSSKSRTRVIGSAIDEYKEARSESRRLSISAAVVKQKQADLEAAKLRHETLKAESEGLQRELVRLHRIASNKPDIARLQELRSGILPLESIPTLPIDARKQRDDASAALASATSQMQLLAGHIAERNERINALPLGSLLKTHADEIEELHAATSDYVRSVSDRPKRIAEREEAIELAEGEWKAFWHQRPITDAETLRITYSQRSGIFALITEHARLSTALAQAQEDARTGKEEQERLQQDLALHPDPPDPGMLIAAIEQAKSLGDTDEAISRLNVEIERLTAAANRDLKTLRGWSGTIQELEVAQMPLWTMIDDYTAQSNAIVTARRERRTRLSEIATEIQERKVELDSLIEEVARAGENELSKIRARRDQLWHLIRASAFDKTLSGEEAQEKSNDVERLELAFPEYVRRADEVADLRFANAKEVVIHDRLVKELDSAQIEKEETERQIDTLDGEERELSARWESEWPVLASKPLAPQETKEWMQRRQSILDRFDVCREKKAELGVWQQRVFNAVKHLCDSLAELGRPVPGECESLSVVTRFAEGIARSIQDQRSVSEDIRKRLLSLSVEKREAKLVESMRAFSDWSRRWDPIITGLLLPEGSTPETVGEALVLLEKVFDQLKDADRLQHRIKRIGDNIDLFETRANKIIAAVDASLDSLSIVEAVTELHVRLAEVGRAQTERETLEAQNIKDQASISNWASKANLAGVALQRLRELASCSDDSELDGTITAAEQREQKRTEYDRIAVGLIERNAVPDLKLIEEEASGYEVDSLQSEIQSKDARQRAVQDELFKAGSEYGQLLQEFERLENTDESAAQAQMAEDALAKVRVAVSQYLRLRLASEVLQRAIDSYREKHQGPVLNRASQLFSSLTIGEYSGLTTGFGDDDDEPVVVAVRRSRDRVQIDGLSDGTRDQLYLALRLAAIEHHVEAVGTCPVIFDDILINSDDARAEAALRAIGELAKSTQVLFFTHHRRLAELGNNLGAQVLDLGSSALLSI
jgi:uncharacterized protein YhaN